MFATLVEQADVGWADIATLGDIAGWSWRLVSSRRFDVLICPDRWGKSFVACAALCARKSTVEPLLLAQATTVVFRFMDVLCELSRLRSSSAPLQSPLLLDTLKQLFNVRDYRRLDQRHDHALEPLAEVLVWAMSYLDEDTSWDSLAALRAVRLGSTHGTRAVLRALLRKMEAEDVAPSHSGGDVNTLARRVGSGAVISARRCSRMWVLIEEICGTESSLCVDADVCGIMTSAMVHYPAAVWQRHPALLLVLQGQSSGISRTAALSGEQVVALSRWLRVVWNYTASIESHDKIVLATQLGSATAKLLPLLRPPPQHKQREVHVDPGLAREASLWADRSERGVSGFAERFVQDLALPHAEWRARPTGEVPHNVAPSIGLPLIDAASSTSSLSSRITPLVIRTPASNHGALSLCSVVQTTTVVGDVLPHSLELAGCVVELMEVQVVSRVAAKCETEIDVIGYSLQLEPQCAVCSPRNGKPPTPVTCIPPNDHAGRIHVRDTTTSTRVMSGTTVRFVHVHRDGERRRAGCVGSVLVLRTKCSCRLTFGHGVMVRLSSAPLPDSGATATYVAVCTA